MLAFRTTGRFEKDFKLSIKRGKDLSKLKAVMRALVQEVPLDPRLRIPMGPATPYSGRSSE